MRFVEELTKASKPLRAARRMAAMILGRITLQTANRLLPVYPKLVRDGAFWVSVHFSGFCVLNCQATTVQYRTLL